MGEATRDESTAIAQRLAAAAELFVRRSGDLSGIRDVAATLDVAQQVRRTRRTADGLATSSSSSPSLSSAAMTDASPEATAEEPAPTLLTAVLVLAFTEFNTEGHWTPIDTVIGAIVSVILLAYTHTALKTGPWPKAIAIALAYATSFTITLTYFVQFGVRHGYHPTGADQDAVNAKVGDASTAVAAVIALFVTAGVCAYLRRDRHGSAT